MSLISIIIPTKNAGETLRETLNSLACQSSFDFEILIQDGVSTDETIPIAKSFSEKSGRKLQIFSERDSGVYDAMNKAIEKAEGEWLYFLGSDDLLSDEMVIEDVTNTLVNTDADIVYGDVLLRSTNENYGGEFNLERIIFKENICHQAIIYNRKIFQRLGLFNINYKIWADWDFNIRCFKYPMIKARYINRVIAVYEDRKGISHTRDPLLEHELPAFIHEDYSNRLKILENSKDYKFGKSVLTPLRKIRSWLRKQVPE